LCGYSFGIKNFVTTLGFLLAIGVIYGARALTYSISVPECASLVVHSPSADVAYRPGIDAEGRRVAPADLGGGTSIDAPKRLEIPITVDLQKRLGIPADPNLFQTQNFSVGTVVWENGRASFNGVPLQNEQMAALVAYCKGRAN